MRVFQFPLAVLVLSGNLLGSACAEERVLFNGKDFTGWSGETNQTWRVENGALVAGSVDVMTTENHYLSTTGTFRNFDLTLEYRLTGTEGFVNGGVQFRSTLAPAPTKIIGYQADLGKGHDGSVYDEHRRNRFLARAPDDVLAKALKPGEWNRYRIRAEGSRVQVWLNGEQTVDFTETDASVPREGVIAVQIHGNAKAKAEYRDIRLTTLTD